MKSLKVTIAGLSLTLLCSNLFAHQTNVSDSLIDVSEVSKSDFRSTNSYKFSSKTSNDTLQFLALSEINYESTKYLSNSLKGVSHSINNVQKSLIFSQPKSVYKADKIELKLLDDKKDFFLNNRRNRYSSLWAFASLNYLYADLVGVMDKNKLVQYQTGVVEGVKITPQFLTVAAAFMQIPLANVFLPQVIKNEKVLRWVQIASGSLMTLVQSGTLFVGKPTPYYALFSTFEIAATTCITIDAIKWKPNGKKAKI